MTFQRILITGGAGFVGSNLASMLKEKHPQADVSILDNLRRQGSELRLASLRDQGVRVPRGDIRCREDLEAAPDFDLLIDCAAEPLVHAGTTGSPAYLLNNNLTRITAWAGCRSNSQRGLSAGQLQSCVSDRCTERPAFRRDGNTIWLDSRTGDPGVLPTWHRRDVSLHGPRSFYGASKLASEMILQEYVHSYGMPGLINRCGLLTGPWQMGKVDQGVVSLWVARHCFGKPLQYIGFGGKGKQVRDILHIADLLDLVDAQIRAPEKWTGRAYNVSGGLEYMSAGT